MIDTGSAVTLFDEDFAFALGLANGLDPERRLRLVGIEGQVLQAPFWRVEVTALAISMAVTALVGFVPRLAKSTGNLLGRDFLESVHFGLDHRKRTQYLGSAGPRPYGRSRKV